MSAIAELDAPLPLRGGVGVGGSRESGACCLPPSLTLPRKGAGKRSAIQQTVDILNFYGVIEIGEKSTNQLLGCTKPWIFGLMARGPTSWAT